MNRIKRNRMIYFHRMLMF